MHVKLLAIATTLRDRNLNDQLIKPSNTPTNRKNLVKIDPVFTEILWQEIDIKNKQKIYAILTLTGMHIGRAKNLIILKAIT